MSSRQLRKLQQQRELEQAKWLEQAKLQPNEQAEEEESEEEEDTPLPARKGNAFSNFALLEDGNDEPSEDEDDEQDNEPPAEETISPPKAAAPVKSKKSKKKSKAAKSRKAPAASKKEPKNGEDEIDAALRALKLENKGTSSGTIEKKAVDVEYEKICSLLGISTQHLKVANEMKNLFGRTAANNHDDDAGGQAGRRRRRGVQQQIDLETALKGHHAPGKGLPEVTLRRNIFIQGKDDWPRAGTGGLTMEIVDDQRNSDGTVEFRYVHDQAYENLQQQFNMFVDMGDPQNLIGLLQRHRRFTQKAFINLF